MKLILTLITLTFAVSAVLGQDCADLESELEKGDLQVAFNLAKTSENSTYPHCLNLSGQVYLRRGDFDTALSIFEKAERFSEVKTSEKANSLNNIGLTLQSTGNYQEAITYLQRAYDIRLSLFGQNSEEIAASLNDIGFVLTLSNPDLALINYEKSLKIYKNVLGEKSQKVAQSLLNTAIIYLQQEFYGDAANNLNEALNIWQELYPEGHPNEGIIYYYLAQNSKAIGQVKPELEYLELARENYIKHYGKEHPETAFILTRIGNYHNEQGDFKTALDLYQQALISNTPDWNEEDIKMNPPVSNYYRATTQLSTLYYKARAFMDKYYVKTRKFADLKMSLQTLYSCDSLIDKIRQVRISETDKLELGQSSALVYEMGVLLCEGITEVVTKREQYHKQALYFAEKSKSAVLLEAISDASAKSYANIPKVETDKEQQLKTDITFWEQQLAKELGNQQNVREKLFELKKEYEEFIARLEQRYPAYYNLKYNVAIPNVEQIQETLDDNTMVLSYFIAEDENRLVIFKITKDDFEVKNKAIDENMDRYINGLRNSLFFRVDDVYKLTATALYDQLIPKIGKSVNQLVIIPSGRLGTIPFETLLKASPKNNDYADFPFMVKDFNISYQYALALYYQNQLTKIKGANATALLCAPVKFETLPDLPASEIEVKNLKRVFEEKSVESKTMLMNEANESDIKAGGLSNYQYLHFATHGVVDALCPKRSRIYLGPGKSDDGALYSAEIYNLNLDASLVTLSACETGLGKLSKGEGIIGLSRALIYAGAKNLVVSLWSVSDNSTAELMMNFYTKINYNNYALSLRSAKLDMIASNDYAKPYYWAPFILIGR
ncbi:MAG: CHAT domain-containing tetratricopeptide repeat protein [Bacteroidota bacterium]